MLKTIAEIIAAIFVVGLYAVAFALAIVSSAAAEETEDEETGV